MLPGSYPRDMETHVHRYTFFDLVIQLPCTGAVECSLDIKRL
ncbi:hypothetical protein T03_12555 [Trichinella britovi]|uniref:Uncharacterized protein n=1 Tax=Trichinella britovi TaxID=45882 RepID=A0A0V0Z801_TRIBR|nr:hypothetical protein T03_12555 [Trichinella britovi]